MSKPLGNCPVCEKEIRPGEDAVVCPDCGTPYHRECYLQTGQCLYKEKHGTGYEYTAPGATASPGGEAQRAGGGQLVCHNCGASNPPQGIFCDNCGTPLHTEPRTRPATGPLGGAFGGPGMGAQTAPDLNGEIDGIPKGDWATYIGPNSNQYLGRMEVQKQRNNKFSFLFSAFFVPHFYFAYRKMWGWAALACAVMLAISVPDYLYMMYDSGINPLNLTYPVLEWLSNVAFIVSPLLRVGFSMFSVYIYRRSAGKHIKALKAQHETDPAAYSAALAKKGGTSALGVLAVVVLFGAIYAFLILGLGIDVMGYYTGIV